MQPLLIIILGKIVAILLGFYYYKFLSDAYRLILYQVIVALLCESFARYLVVSHPYRYNNLWVFNLYLLCEMWLDGMAGRLLIRNNIIKQAVFYTLLGLTVLWGVNIYLVSMASFANWCFVATSIVFIIIYFIVLFDTALFNAKSILIQPAFWLCLSIILFYGCDLPYFGLRNYLIKHQMRSTELKLYVINSILNFIRYPLVAVSFIFCRNTNKQKSVIKIA